MSGVNCTRPLLSCRACDMRAHQQCLAEAGHAFDEYMAGRHQREHHFFDHARLPDDRFADAGAQLAEQVGGFLDGAGFSVFHVSALLISKRRRADSSTAMASYNSCELRAPE